MSLFDPDSIPADSAPADSDSRSTIVSGFQRVKNLFNVSGPTSARGGVLQNVFAQTLGPGPRYNDARITHELEALQESILTLINHKDLGDVSRADHSGCRQSAILCQ